MSVGTVLRSHAGGYLVYLEDVDLVFQCAARGRIKKERSSIVTGDQVQLGDLNISQGTAVIEARLDRQNRLSRPPLANVAQVVIVQSVHQPDWNALWSDRYIVHFQLELPGEPPVLCFNKCDLAQEADLDALRSIYEPLGYFVIFASAFTGKGLDVLAEVLHGKISVLAGPSGVGKSSILNKLVPSLEIRTGQMKNDFGVGRHTTTASELYRLKLSTLSEKVSGDNERSSWVADSPGFNLLEMNLPLPAEVAFQFPEILALSEHCKFADCLHLVEQGCNVIEHLSELSEGRYSSYMTLIGEAQTLDKQRRTSSQKVEAKVKQVGRVQVPLLSAQYRAASRRREKQDFHTNMDDHESETPDDA